MPHQERAHAVGERRFRAARPCALAGLAAVSMVPTRAVAASAAKNVDKEDPPGPPFSRSERWWRT